MSRYFRIEVAESLLPDIQREIEDAIRLRQAYQAAEEHVQSAVRRVAMLGGANVDRGAIAANRETRSASASALNGALDKIQSYGCLVKDLDIGLIDFPTRFRGREVLLCWKLGENGIHWWHGLEEGFRGRKPIDDDFLANHEGERPS